MAQRRAVIVWGGWPGHEPKQGRIFYTALGHVTAEFENASMRRILRRGLNWAGRQAAP